MSARISSIRSPSARRNFNKPIRIMDWHARACEPVSVRRLCPTKVQRVLSESLIRFVPRGSYPGEKTERPRKRKRERGKGRGGENLAERTFRNSKWTAVSDVGATEVRKYFSTFVTRPVYWFRQIVVERGSEIRDARRQRDAGGGEGKGRKGGRVERRRVFCRRQSVSVVPNGRARSTR